MPVQLLKIFPPERHIEPHVRQFFLNAVRTQAVVEVFEVDKIQMLVLVEA